MSSNNLEEDNDNEDIEEMKRILEDDILGTIREIENDMNLIEGVQNILHHIF